MFDMQAKLSELCIQESDVSSDALKIRCLVKSGTVEIMVSEEIGDDGWGGGVSADEIGKTLSQNPTSDVSVRINSPGGMAYDGLKIFNLLSAHAGHVTTINEGLAYSAASIIFMAGDDRQVHAASDFGIHRAQGGGFGNQYMLAAISDFLGGIDEHMIGIYSERSGNNESKIRDWIDGTTNGVMGTMFSGNEAVDAGFADTVISRETAKIKATFRDLGDKVAAIKINRALAGVRLKIAAARSVADLFS